MPYLPFSPAIRIRRHRVAGTAGAAVALLSIPPDIATNVPGRSKVYELAESADVNVHSAAACASFLGGRST